MESRHGVSPEQFQILAANKFVQMCREAFDFAKGRGKLLPAQPTEVIYHGLEVDCTEQRTELLRGLTVSRYVFEDPASREEVHAFFLNYERGAVTVYADRLEKDALEVPRVIVYEDGELKNLPDKLPGIVQELAAQLA